MPLIVTVTSKVKGTEDVFLAKAVLEVDGKSSNGKVLVKDLGEGKASLHINDEIRPSVINNTDVLVYKVNGEVADPESTYENALKNGVELEFSQFSFSHKK
jgi:fructose-specific phosphotransferase system component IIB